MPDVWVAIRLPYLLRLPSDEYATPAAGGSIRFREITIPSAVDGPGELRTEASTTFTLPPALEEKAAKRLRFEEGDRLLRRTNHLLRWYRAASRQPQIAELSRAQASPFRFMVAGTDTEWTEPLEYVASPVPLPASASDLQRTVSEGLASAVDPPVAALSLLDAEYAIKTGRFREAVLFCWSAIDSTFGRKYEVLVDNALAGEWGDARKFFRGHADIPMRHRMSAMMHLVANRSLYREPGLWNDLSTSYDHRNNIIHHGDNATETHAELALDVATKVVAIMNAL
jgi:hypothetical protein